MANAWPLESRTIRSNNIFLLSTHNIYIHPKSRLCPPGIQVQYSLSLSSVFVFYQVLREIFNNLAAKCSITGVPMLNKKKTQQKGSLGIYYGR